MEAVEGSQVRLRDEQSEIGFRGAKDLTGTLANSRSTRQLGKRIFCDNKAEEIPSLYPHNIYYDNECEVTE